MTPETIELDQFSDTCEKINLQLLDNSTHILSEEIDDSSIEKTLRWLVYENMDPQPKTLTLYINSRGGDICGAFGLIDLMRSSKHTIRTIGIGNVMSSGFMIFAAGTKGQRYIGENTSILCHQYSDEHEGKYHDLKSRIQEGDRINSRMVDLLVKNSGLSQKAVKSKLLNATDVWLTAHQTIEYGIADHIL
jgi:ATP-dependent Clp endopeptidase proteolytic subunit ClpP